MVKLRRIVWSTLLIVSVLSFWGTAYGQKREPDVRFVPTPMEVVMEMLKTARVTQNDVIYDLGCGDGRIVITAAKLFGARGMGVDIDPVRIQESSDNARKAGVSERVKFIEQDLFTLNLSEPTVVTLYLLSDLNLKLRPKLFRELRPGTRIVSHEFNMFDWRPDYVGVVPKVEIYYNAKVPDVRDSHFYYWVIPANVAGEWRWTLPTSTGEQNYTLRVVQKFQTVSGKVTVDGRETPISDAQLLGDQLSFTLRDEASRENTAMRFHGRMSGDTMNGTVDIRGRPSGVIYNWTATRKP